MKLPPGHIFAGLPARAAGALLVDVPWFFRCYTPEIGNRDPRRHYKVLTLADLCALPVCDLAAPDAHLFMWVTGPCLPQAFDVMKAWGFRYSGIAFTWVKLKRSCRTITSERDFHTGLGFTTRKNTELCLLARRGNAKRVSKSVRELIIAPRREHSRKPDEARQRIEQYCAGPYVELFARSSRRGWTTWGNEAAKYDAPILREAA